MYAVEKISSYITRGVYTVSGPFHPFGGAVDIIVVQQQDGSFKSSPWYVRFGKFQGVLQTREKVVTICVNGVEAGFHMYMDHKGEAYFLKDCDSDEEGNFEMSLPSSGDELDEKIRSVRINKVQSCNYEESQKEPIVPFESGNGAVVSRTSSKRSQLLKLMFGGKSMRENDKGANIERVNSLESAAIAADLLETKWQTNLPSNHTRTSNPLEKGDFVVDTASEEMVGSHEEGKDDNFRPGIASRELLDDAVIPIPPMVTTNSIGNGKDPCLGTGGSVNESAGSYDEKLGNNILPDTVMEVHFEETTSTSRTHEEVLEVNTLKTGDLGVSRKHISGSEMLEADEYGILSMRPISDNLTDCIQSTVSTADGNKYEAKEKENYDGKKEVSSLSCVETSESSTANFEVSTQTHNALFVGDRDSEVTCKTSEHICELTSCTESENATENENCFGCHSQDSELSSSKVFQDTKVHFPSNVAFHETKTNGSDVDSVRVSCSPESEIIYQESETIGLSQVNIAKNEEINFVQDRFQVNQEAALESNCHIPSSNDISFISNGVPESASPGKGVIGEKPCHQNTVNIVPEESRFSVSESLEEEQFQFSDIHKFSTKMSNPEVKVSNFEEQIYGRDVEEQDTKYADHEDCFDSVSGSWSSPVAIPRNTKQSREVEPSAKSVPIIRSRILDLDYSNLLHPLSCSLDRSSENYVHDSLKKEILSSPKLESDSGCNCSTQEADTAVDSEDTQGHGVGLINSAVELSLCKHSLFEGMGSDAASRVSETNKEQILEPESMFDLDQDEKKFSADPTVPTGGTWRLWPFSSKKSTTINTVYSVPESTTQGNVDVVPMRSQSLTDHAYVHRAKFKKKKVRSLIPTSEELSLLNLKEGRNVITFSFSTAMLGQQQMDAMMYLWKWNTRIVISDVDGTITRSDVLGQFMSLVGKDWSQTGVAHLFSAIKENGYQFLFLSARAISQAYLTRQFLFNLKQDGKALPDGPVVISPDGLFPSLYREVIRRAPHEFKISCLEDIRALFPPHCNPFYAGFGNRDTDEISYLKVGIPKGKIFIINPKGEVSVNRRVDTKSYTKLHALVNCMFPPMSTTEQEDYNSWNYWKLPLPDIDV